MNKKIISGCALAVLILAAWGGNVMGKESNKEKSISGDEQSSLEEIYVVEPEQEMIQIEQKDAYDDESIVYELTDEEEELGLKFTE